MSRFAAIAGERLRWYLNRLRCMTAAEVGHRLLRALASPAARWHHPRPSATPLPDAARAVPAWIRAPAEVDAAPYLQAATGILGGKFDLFALRGIELGSVPRWNRDPKTGVEAPLVYGGWLDYRDARLVGDIKYLWELNRHLHLVTLAQAYCLAGDARFARAIRHHLESWFAACPCPMGPNWSSALEAAIRLINWSATWQLLGGAGSPLFGSVDGERFRRRWLASVFEHARFVRANFSLYSSANNHLVGESAGLFIAALTWPCWPQASAWRDDSRAMLEREALLQNFPDGVNREQAVCYQRFVLELLLLALLAGRANGIEFPAHFLQRLEAMAEFLASIMDAGGNVPMLGDSDDGRVLRLAPGGDGNADRRLLAAGAVLFKRAQFKAKARELDGESRWLLGEGAPAAFAAIDCETAPLPVRNVFPEGGYYVLGCDFETADEIRLVADAGPLGYLAIAAHGHADALAFTLSIGGLEFLIDPGTFAYHTQRRWRDYFRGTAAHNTLRIDGVDQSQPGGSFMWLHKACARCSLWSSADRLDLFEGWHDGYLRLPDPVRHRRRISLHKPVRRVLIEDTLEMAATHDVELFLHCSEHCRVEPAEGGYALAQGTRRLLVRLPRAGGATSQVHQGSEAPILGWVSRSYDRRRPAPTIAWRARLAGPSLLRTEILC